MVFRKVQCQHCQEPSCASACLVRAYTKTPEGPVLWNPEVCIGCRMCLLACPFSIPAFEYHNPRSPAIRKCTLCADRLKKGGLPACAEACPAEAITFGQRRNLIRLARERIREKPKEYIDPIYGEPPSPPADSLRLETMAKSYPETASVAISFSRTGGEMPVCGCREWKRSYNGSGCTPTF